MKTPDEIKKGMERCGVRGKCHSCPYESPRTADCVGELLTDALDYIQQLERERDAAVEAIEHTCATCKHYYYNSADGSDCKYDCLEGADGCHNGNTRWEWVGVEEADHA